MILIGKYPSIKLKSEYSIFIKFKIFDRKYVDMVKTLPVRQYIPEEKVWEVPISDMDRVVHVFGLDNIQIFNEFPEFAQYLRLQEEKKKNKRSVEELIAYYEQLRPEVDYKFKTRPDGHQIESFNAALHLDNLFITDVMGLGKTKQAIDICDYKKSIGESKHVLVICGVNGLKYNWKDLEIPKHSWYNAQVIDGSKKQKIEKLKSYYMFYYNIINIESIRNNEQRDKQGRITKENDNEILEILIKLCDSGKFDTIIIDEFHKANNHKSQQGKGLSGLKSKFKIALSGTPITKKIERSWNILHWFGYETASYWNFLKRYCVLGGYSGYEPIGYQNLDELHERFDKYQIRRTKDILKLPPKVHQNVYVEMTNEERKEYNKIKQGIITDVESGEVKMVQPMVATIKLRLFTDKIKVRAVKEFIDELQDNDQPCVIFSCFKEGLNNLANEIYEYKPLICTGDLKKASDKQKVIDDFQDHKLSDVILGTTQAMGTGYTLTRAEYVGFLNKSIICTDNDQAEDRCHRRGTTGSVTVVSFIVKNSIDERVEEILENDKLYIDKVVDGVPIFKLDGKTIFDKLMSDD
jgi:SNF2 family DNA or RNA helicase